MGVVYKAVQKSLNRLVAIKILAPEREHDAKFAGRFAREAELLAKLSHPHIVTIHDFGESGELYYLMMEYVDGVSLRDLLRDGKLEPQQALAIVPQICDALQFAHDRGIVHRDIKPENILLNKAGQVKIADFGVAKIIANELTEIPGSAAPSSEMAGTEAGKVIGTPQYMAPEQLSHPLDVDNRADIYALGVVFYQMLTGELPVGKFEPPSRKVQIDVRLDDIVLRALQKQPELRYQQASVMKTQVETIAATHGGNEKVEGGGPSESPVAPILKSERARLAVQESSDARVNYPAMDEVTLYTDRLVISSGYNQRSIPLVDIHELGEAVMPFWFNPGPHRYAAVDFDEAGQRRRLAFLAGSSMFRSPGDTRLHAAEWLTAIQKAIKSDTGRDVPIAQGPTVMPVKITWALMWLPVPLLAAIPLIASLLSRSTPDSHSVMIAAQISGAFMLLPVLSLFSVYVIRSISLRGTVKRPLGCATSSAGIPPVNPSSAPPGSGRQNVEIEPHFSRTAIVGACLGMLSVVMFAFAAIINQVATIWQPTGEVLPNKPAELVSGLLIAGGVLCVLGFTLLGWIAVSQIRRSAGKLYGMWLAVFDGLLFPLLAVDGLFLVAAVVIYFSIMSPFGYNGHGDAGPLTLVAILLCGVVVVSIVVDFLIIRAVWRAANKPTGKLTAVMAVVFGGLVAGGFIVLLLTMAFLVFSREILVIRHQGQSARQQMEASVYRPLLRVTLRVLDVPHGLDTGALVRPAALFDRGDVRVIASPSVVVTSGEEGVIHIPEDAEINPDGAGSAILGGKTRTLFVDPTYQNGSSWVRYTLDGLTSTGNAPATRQKMRSNSVYLGEFQLLEENGAENGRSQWAVLTIEMESAQTMPTILAAAQNSSFGPVIEHVLPMDKDGLTSLFDVDHDKLVPDPGPGDTQAGLTQLFSSGLVVSHDEAKGQTVLIGMAAGTVTQSIPVGQWETMNAAEAAAAIDKNPGKSGMGVMTAAVATGKPPLTFLFKTPSGKVGLWQVEEYVENRSVKIRYKLVQGDKTQSAAIASPSSPR